MVEIVGLYDIRTTFDQTGTIQCLNKTKRDMEETNEVNTERWKRENRSSLTFSWFAGKLAVRWAVVFSRRYLAAVTTFKRRRINLTGRKRKTGWRKRLFSNKQTTPCSFHFVRVLTGKIEGAYNIMAQPQPSTVKISLAEIPNVNLTTRIDASNVICLEKFVKSWTTILPRKKTFFCIMLVSMYR